MTDVSGMDVLNEPLTPAVFHILLALSEGERHGYAIQQTVARDTDGKLSMGPGTLYGTLKRLLEAGLVEEAGETERRRYYRLTSAGQASVRGEAARLARLVQVAQERKLVEVPS